MLPDSSTRLNKYISESGICSRREADRYIEQGNVFLNGNRDNARRLLEEKQRFRQEERRLAHAHVDRLAQQVVQSIETSALHLELIADMKRLTSLFCSSAYAQLEALAPAPGDPQTQR